MPVGLSNGHSTQAAIPSFAVPF